MATSRIPRVFLDTNVIISGLHSRDGAPAQILHLHSTGAIRAVVSQLVLEEAVRVARAKLPAIQHRLRDWLFAATPEVAAEPRDNDVVEVAAVVNFDDAPIVAAALAAGVDYFVTGDRRLLREFRVAQTTITVLTPRELVERTKRPQ